MTHQVEVSGEQLPGMQLAGRLALSAAALLLLTLAYRYCKSREPAGAQGGDDAAGDPGQDTEELPGERAGPEDAQEGLRHRWASSKGAMPNGRDWDEPAAQGRARAPVDREQNVLNREEEEEEMTHPEIRLQPDRKCSLSEEEEEEEEASGCRTRAGTPGANPQGGSSSPDQPSRSCSHESPSQEAEPARSGLHVANPGKQAGQSPLSASRDGASWGKGTGQALGGDFLPTQKTLAEQKRLPSSKEPVVNQNDMRSNTRNSVLSSTEAQVGEKPLRPRQAKDERSMSPATDLQGGVYDYHFRAASKPALKEQAFSATLGTQADNQSTANSPDSCKVQPFHAPAHNSAAGDEGRTALNDDPPPASHDDPPPPSGALRSDGKHPQPEDQKVVSREAPGAQKPPAAGRSFHRKESFHKMVESPELLVQMEGFGSPSSLGSSRAPPLSPLSGSVKSLAGSVQSLQADTSKKPTVESVAGAKFFRVPLSAESSLGVRLDLGNCYEALCLAKKQQLGGLREAALKVMSDNYLQVLRTNAIYGRLNARERELILQGRMRGRKYVTVADVSSPDHLASKLCYYDNQTDTWHPLAHMPVEAVSQGCAVCSMFNYLFVVAGCEGRGKLWKPSNRVFCYNPLTNIWREICPLNQARPQCKLVPLDGYLYAIGGECLYTVERYDPRLDRWTFASPLPNDTFAVAHTATACDGEIYVTGGTLRYILLKYVGRTDTWKVTLTGGSKDRTTEMVTTSGFIYRFDLNRRMGISVYRCSSKAKLWYECATYPMPFPGCFQCAVVDNLVYCVSRQFNLCFFADYVSPRFGSKELQAFPSPGGTLLPVTLVLPDRAEAQTRV